MSDMGLSGHLQGRWLHSHEEDTDAVAVYRPAGYAFPPARGRDGFEFRADGEAVRLGIAATDGAHESAATWSVDDSDEVVRIERPADQGQPVLLRVLSVDGDKLRIAR